MFVELLREETDWVRHTMNIFLQQHRPSPVTTGINLKFEGTQKVWGGKNRCATE